MTENQEYPKLPPSPNIYISLFEDKLFNYRLLQAQNDIEIGMDINLLRPDLYNVIRHRHPLIEEIHPDQAYALLFNLDTFLIVEILFGGFSTPQSFVIDSCDYNPWLTEFLEYRGYVKPIVMHDPDGYSGMSDYIYLLTKEDAKDDGTYPEPPAKAPQFGI